MVEALSTQLNLISLKEEQNNDFCRQKLFPYLFELFDDLLSKEEDKTAKGLSAVNFKGYCNLPACIEDRLFAVADLNQDRIVSKEEFLHLIA
jgi:hypothetical protein